MYRGLKNNNNQDIEFTAIIESHIHCYVSRVSCLLHLFQACELPAADSDGGKLVCLMPVVGLSEGLRDQLDKSESETINGRDGPGVAVYRDTDAHVRVDIYVGLELDGFTHYNNISSVSPHIKMQFAVKPSIHCQSGVLTFTPGSDTAIAIQVGRS